MKRCWNVFFLTASAMAVLVTSQANARFLATDPAQFTPEKSASFNRYVYSSNDPVNRIDPNGETDIFIGGAGDRSMSPIVQSYARGQSGQAGRTVRYFSHNQRSEAISFAREAAGNGEPLNIIGHSYGTNTAVGVTKALSKDGIQVDNLIGVDGVRKAGRRSGIGGAEPGSVVGVNSTGGGNGNLVEGLGKALGGVTTMGGGTPRAFQPGQADISINADVSHSDFSGAMNAAGEDGRSAQDILDESYNQ